MDSHQLLLHDYDISNKNLVYITDIIFNILLCSLLELQALEQQLEEAQTENFNIKQMKDLFEQKAAQLATEIAGILNLNFLANKCSYLFIIICLRKLMF
jgi:hypothetical protein